MNKTEVQIPLNVIEYVAAEVDRQKAGPLRVVGMIDAWYFARETSLEQQMPTYFDIQVMAHHIEPEVNHLRGNNNFRTTPVTFANGGHAANHAVIKDAVLRMMDVVEDWPHSSSQPVNVDEIVKALLDIHPWADGNGRTASLIHNWMSGTLMDPHPLPHYYDTEETEGA